MHRIVTTRATREEKSLLADASHSSRDFSSLNGFESSGPSTASSVQTFTSVANRTSEAFSTLRCVDNILRFLSYVYSKKQPFKKHILRNKESNEGKKEDVYYASLSLFLRTFTRENSVYIYHHISSLSFFLSTN